MSFVGLAIGTTGCLMGCATIRVAQARSTQALLAAAGFEQQRIDATEIDRVDLTPPYRLVSRTRNGTQQYSYADPEGCRCVYIGGAKEYSQYRRLAAERRRDEERWRAAEDVWDGIRGDHGIERENVNNDAIGTLTQADPTRNTQVPHAVVGGLPESKVRRVTAYIETNLHRELRLAELAAVTHMSPYHSRASSSGPRGYRRIASWFAAGSTPRRLC